MKSSPLHQDHDPDEALAERLVGCLFADPAPVRSVRDLAAGAGSGASKLNVLFRRHYHTTPLEMLARARIERARRELLDFRKSLDEIGADLGYENLPAFAADFRGRTGLDPEGYRLLLGSDRFSIELPAWFHEERVLAYLGRDPASPTQRVDGRVVRFAVATREAAAVVSVELAGGRARCAIEPVASPAPPRGWGPFVHERVLRLLGLVVDPRPFERRMRRTDGLARLVEGRRGLTVPQTHDLVDALVWVIVGQQVSLHVAFQMRRRLAETFGRRVGELALWPELETVAQLGYGELQEIGFSRRKAEYLVDVARSVAGGELDLEALALAPATAVERRLLAVRGLGPWSVHYLMMRALALADCVPVGDVALARSLAEFFALEERPGKQRVLELMEPFAPYRSLATFHLWSRLGDVWCRRSRRPADEGLGKRLAIVPSVP